MAYETAACCSVSAEGSSVGASGTRYRTYQAISPHAVASEPCSHEYVPCDPSGLKTTITHVEKPAMTAIARRDCVSGATTTSSQV